MRWSSFATVLGAALLPAASARALCRPDRSTTTIASTLVETATTLETLSTDAATIATSIETSATAKITDDASETTAVTETTAASETSDATTTGDAENTAASETTTASEATGTSEATDATTTGTSDTTVAETQTATATTDMTTLMTSSATEAASTTQAASTIEASSTVSEAPIITDFIANGRFEDIVNTDWALQSASIKYHETMARTGKRYVEYKLNNEVAEGANKISQAVSGLSTERTYRLTGHLSVFNFPTIVRDSTNTCVVDVSQSIPTFTSRLAFWIPDFVVTDRYADYSIDFSPLSADISLSFVFRCTTGARVTLSVGLDDISLEDVGPRIVG
ncbi:hypothetical protein ACHAPQ_010658 [Fusarium lateritium]